MNLPIALPLSLLMTSTYSAEDNKLRIYASERLETELYKRFKDAGFNYAPKQELFVAPRWTPARADFCIEMAGSIDAEESTMIERAEAKAERLDTLATKNISKCSAFESASRALSERFAGGQPILVGHHSERKARKDKNSMDNAQANALKAKGMANYWNSKAEGVEHHANHKNRDDVRARRIKTLLAELRDKQRDINQVHKNISLWLEIKQKSANEKFNDLVLYWAGSYLNAPSIRQGKGLYEKLRDGEMTAMEVVDFCTTHYEKVAKSTYTMRWIQHILGRLGYERSELGATERFSGELTPVIIQAFAREHGTDKPKAKKTDLGFSLESLTPLPFHIADALKVNLDATGWTNLMQSCGYEVPQTKPKPPPILNFKCHTVTMNIWREDKVFQQAEVTKEEYKAVHKDSKGVRPSACGKFRMRFAHVREDGTVSNHWTAAYVPVFIVGSKVHEAPESDSYSLTEAEKKDVATEVD